MSKYHIRVYTCSARTRATSILRYHDFHKHYHTLGVNTRSTEFEGLNFHQCRLFVKLQCMCTILCSSSEWLL